MTIVEFIPQEVVKKENLHMNMFDQQHVRNLIERYGEDYEVYYNICIAMDRPCSEISS